MNLIYQDTVESLKKKIKTFPSCINNLKPNDYKLTYQPDVRYLIDSTMWQTCLKCYLAKSSDAFMGPVRHWLAAGELAQRRVHLLDGGEHAVQLDVGGLGRPPAGPLLPEPQRLLRHHHRQLGRKATTASTAPLLFLSVDGCQSLFILKSKKRAKFVH